MTGIATGRVPSVAFIGIVLAVVATDQVSKRVVTRELGPGAGRDRLEVLGDLVTLAYGRNTGVAFGLFAGAGTVLTVLVVALTLAVALHAWRGRGGAAGERVGLALMLGGAIGNLVDRVRLGYVVDFISVGVWPAFNLADTAISIGVVALAAGLFRDEPTPASGARARPSPADGDGRPLPGHDRGTRVHHHG